MPTNDKITLLQCAVCPARLECPWGQFSNAIRQKYCPFIRQAAYAPESGPVRDQQLLQQFIEERLN